MQITKGKISIRQAFIIVLLAIVSPSLRILPTYASEIAKEAGWIAIIVAIIPVILLIYMFNNIFSKYPNNGLDEIFEIVLGKIIGKIIIVFYILWILFLFALYLRYFCERFLSTILVDTPVEFMLLVMLGFLFYIIKNNIEAFARMSELFLFIFLGIFILVFLIMLPDIKLSNLYPVTIYDVPAIFKASTVIFSLVAYLTFMFFLGDKINHKGSIKKYGLRFAWINTILGIMLTVTVIGVLGANLTPKFPIPYFTVIKSIEILNTIERVESIFIAIWVINDCIILGMFAYILLSLLQRFSKTDNTRIFIAPLIFFSYVAALYIASSSLELRDFSKQIAGTVNNITGFIIPFIVFIIGKIRKKI